MPTEKQLDISLESQMEFQQDHGSASMPLMRSNIFDVKRMSNGYGHSNLIAIIREAIPDMSIGDALIVPYLHGYKDPIQVKILLDVKGIPMRTNLNSCVVLEYIYE